MQCGEDMHYKERFSLKWDIHNLGRFFFFVMFLFSFCYVPLNSINLLIFEAYKDAADRSPQCLAVFFVHKGSVNHIMVLKQTRLHMMFAVHRE